jgi:hypothetical protein
MFGKQLASETLERQLLNSNINNQIVEINGENGITISGKDTQGHSYGIRLTSLGMQFLLNGTYQTV